MPSNEKRPDLDELYGSRSYIEAYTAHMDMRVTANPQEAIGGMWEEMGRLQIDYLRSRGLEPQHRLLDIGCGTLRAGRHFIAYLDVGGYTGFDLSAACIAFGENLVDAEGLRAKAPRLYVSPRKDLTFAELADGPPFDALLAQSVFTHLPEEYIAECFAHLGRVMGPTSKFYFTFVSAVMRRPLPNQFAQSLSYYEEIASRHGIAVVHGDDFKHPRGLLMGIASLA